MISAGLASPVMSAGDVTASADLPSPKRLTALDHPAIPLTRDGQAVATVHLAAGTPLTPALRHMLDELVISIEATTGVKIDIDLTGKDLPPPGQGVAILLGDTSQARAAGIQADALDEEHFVIRTALGRVYIVGSSRPVEHADNDGLAWGISEFLERFVGVRWYWPMSHGGRSVVENPSLRIPAVDLMDGPAFRLREAWPPRYGHTYVGSMDVRPLYAALRGGSSWPHRISVHQPANWDKVYTDSRPEIFALRADGTRNFHLLCYSHPRTLETFIENIAFNETLSPPERREPANAYRVAFIRGQAISISPADTSVFCACERCTPLFDEHLGRYASASRLMADFTVRLARQVQTRWPQKVVMYLPYVNYTLVPEGVTMPSNVQVQLCGMPGMAMYKEPSLRDQFQANIDAWARLTAGRVQTWDYACWPTDRTRAFYQYPHVLQAYYQTNRDTLIGTFINGQEQDEWTRHHPSLYLWMKLLWNPDFDVDAAMDVYAQRMYGKGAPAIREILKIASDRWEQTLWDRPVISPAAVYRHSFPRPVIDRMMALLQEAHRLTADDGPAQARLAFFRLPFDNFLTEAASILDGQGLKGLIAPKAPTNPIVDGRLDDAAWQLAEPVTFEVRRRDGSRHPAKYETQVRMVWTPDGVTIAMRMAEPNTAALKMDITTRDDPSFWPTNDNAELFLDVTGSKDGQFYQVLFNPAGAVTDVHNDQIAWSAVGMKIATHIDGDHWSAEVFLPYSAMPDAICPGTGVRWAGQFTRHRIADGRDRNDDDSITEYSRMNNQYGSYSRNAADFGVIQFIE